MDYLKFKDNDYFLVFNYTHTLQNIYNIMDKKMHYVHGECLGNDDDELIIGHGNFGRINALNEKISNLEEEYDYTQSSSNEIEEYNCLLRILRKFRKNVLKCKYYCNLFFNQIDDNIQTIRVLGMSLGEVDIPYLKQIRERWPDAKWEFAYHSPNGISRIEGVAEDVLSLNKDDYSIFRFSNAIAPEIQKKIIELQNISTYQSL